MYKSLSLQLHSGSFKTHHRTLHPLHAKSIYKTNLGNVKEVHIHDGDDNNVDDHGNRA